jgi:hypothetical protein
VAEASRKSGGFPADFSKEFPVNSSVTAGRLCLKGTKSCIFRNAQGISCHFQLSRAIFRA